MIDRKEVTFGNMLLDARKKKGMRLREVAQQLNVSIGFVGDMEKGRRWPSFPVLEKIMLIMGLPKTAITCCEKERLWSGKNYRHGREDEHKKNLEVIERMASPDHPYSGSCPESEWDAETLAEVKRRIEAGVDRV
jgi:transcriptional regulator with XRE-family HTH domain